MNSGKSIIAEIVEREVVAAIPCTCYVRGRPQQGYHDGFCATLNEGQKARAACLAVAKAVVEKCAEEVERGVGDSVEMFRVARVIRALTILAKTEDQK